MDFLLHSIVNSKQKNDRTAHAIRSFFRIGAEGGT